ncbi:hypothetical protein [Staphylococcus aureus]|uniref:hypothetical protein n=1 Tax=Staphylococcus aureus TaxID=1280 RepID=UPI001F06E561|nr:hypothetical protein [Staphylococcus aureus]
MIKPYTFKYQIRFKEAISDSNRHCNKGVKNSVFFNGKASTKGPNKNEIHIGIINKVLVKPTSKGFCVHCKTIQVVET